MNCTHCNAELPKGAKVCEYCDCAVKNKENGKGLRIIVGGLYAIAALLLIYMPNIGYAITGNFNKILTGLTGFDNVGAAIAGITALTNAMTLSDNFFFPTAGLMMAVAALSLLLKKKGAYKAAVISGIAGLVSAAYALYMCIAVPAFPQVITKLYANSDLITNAVVTLTRSEFSFTLRYIVAFVLTAAVSVPAFILALKAKKNADSELCGKMERSMASLMTFLPLVGIALRVRGMFSSVYASAFGQNALAANSMAEGIVSSLISISPIMFILITVYCVLMKKFKYPLFIFPGLAALTAYSIIALCSWKGLLEVYMYGMSEDVYGLTRQAIIPKLLGTIFLLIAVYFWIAATARGGMRAWGQIIFAVTFIFFAIILEAVKVTVLSFSISVPLTEIVLGFAMLSAAIPLSIRRREV